MIPLARKFGSPRPGAGEGLGVRGLAVRTLTVWRCSWTMRKVMRKLLSTVFLFAALTSTLVSIQNRPEQPPIRPVPPPGVPVPETDRKDLEAGLKRLSESIDKLRGTLGNRVQLLPDVQIFHEAARVALQYNEFFKPEEIYRAKDLLRQGQNRADTLALGQAPWTTAPGLVVRG